MVANVPDFHGIKKLLSFKLTQKINQNLKNEENNSNTND